jgi:hypothetical protein
MSVDRRLPHVKWLVRTEKGQDYTTYSAAQFAVLLDIRDLLYQVRDSLAFIQGNTAPLRCDNAIQIPNILRKIAANTAKPKRQRKTTKT